jgi:hypothetical protein
MAKVAKYKQYKHIVGETLEWGFSDEEWYIAIKMSKNGVSVLDVSRELDRNVLEILLLADDLIKQNEIEPRATLLRKGNVND